MLRSRAHIPSPLALHVDTDGAAGVAALTGSMLEPVACARASAGWYLGADGLLHQVGNNAIRVTRDTASARDWLLVEPQRTNRVLRGSDFTNATWTKRGAASVVATGLVAPDGTNTAQRLQVGPAAIGVDDLYQYAFGFASGGPVAASLWVRKVDTAGTVVIVSPNGGENGTYLINLATLPAGWVRITPQSLPAGVTLPTPFKAIADGSCGLHIGTGSGATQRIEVWHAQEEDGATATSDIATTSAPATRLADIVTLPNPLTGTVREYAIKVRTKLTDNPANNVAGIVAQGTGLGVPGLCAYFYGASTVVFAVSGAGTYKYTTAGGVAAGERTIAFVNTAGVLSIYVDGAKVSGANFDDSTGGTGIAAQLATWQLGHRATTEPFNGLIRDFRVYRTADPARFLS